MAFHFDEVNDYISLADNAAHTLPDGDWTIAGWLRLDNNTGTLYQYIFSWGNFSAPPSINLYINEDGVAGAGNITINTEDAGTDSISFNGTGTPFTGNTAWTHVIVERVSNTITVYVDNVSQGSETNSLYDNIDRSDALEFGRRIDGNVDRYFGGDMAEWAKWDRALNTDERAALVSGYAPSFFRDSLKWYVPMIRDYLELINNISVTNNGSTIVAHPRIIYPYYIGIGKSSIITHNLASSIDADWSGTGSILPLHELLTSIDAGWTESGAITGGLHPLSASIDADWSGTGSLMGILRVLQSSVDADWSGTASDVLTEYHLGTDTNVDWFSTGQVTFDFSFKWSIEYLEASTSHGFPSVYVEIDNTTQPTGAFPTGNVYDRRLTEIPRLEEVNLDARFGVSGFQRVTLQVDNHDGVINVINLQDAYVRMFFVGDSGNIYKEFNGKVVDWTLSHTVTINVEDIDALAFTEQLPKRRLNDLVEAEKIADGTFANVVVADDLGKSIPVIFGRAVKVPLLYVKADGTSREYDYIIGEGVGLNNNHFQEVFTVYSDDKALDSIEGAMSAATSTTLTLETADRRPDNWYQYWWVEMLTGNAAGQIIDVTSYDSDNNRLTVTTWGTTPTSGTYRLREWRFFDGSQASPYVGYSILRFKKRLGTTNRTDDLYADVNGLQDEVNRARAIESILANSNWGLGLTVDSTSFSTAATAMSAISSFTCEGAILSQTTAIDVLSKLLSFRDMVLSKDDNIQIIVDAAKTSIFNFGLGDETGYNNILNKSPSINYKHPNEKVKNLKVRYRKNHRENDTYLHEFTRSSSTNGADDTLDLPFGYDHDTADKALDYKRKRLAAADRTLPLDVGQDGGTAKRGDRVTVDIPTLGVSSDWEVVGSNVTPAGSNNFSLVPYSASPYTYVAFTAEGGTLPVDEAFDIPPDYTATNPDPISNVSVSMLMDTFGISQFPYAKITWTAPEDNYGGAIVATKLSSEGSTAWRDVGTFDESARVDGLTPGLNYDFRITSLNITGEHKGLAALDNTNLAGGDSTAPNIPTGVTGSSKLGRLIWTFTKSSSSDVWYHEAEVYTASSGGTRLYRIKIWDDDDPRVEFERQTGNLKTALTGYCQVKAVDYSGNASSFTSRVVATTNDVVRDDLEDNATMNIEVTSNNSALPGVSQTINTWYTVLSDTITTDRTGIIKIRYNGQWEDTGSGFELRLKRGAGVIKTFSYGGAVNGLDATLAHGHSVSSGANTYTIETRNTVQGGTGLGLADNSLTIQGNFK